MKFQAKLAFIALTGTVLLTCQEYVEGELTHLVDGPYDDFFIS